MIKPVIARHEIADADSEQEKRHSMIPKQLKRNEHRCDRTISNTAEYRHHSDRRTKRWRNPKKLPEQTAECRTNKKRRHNLTALKARFQCKRRKNNLPDKGKRIHLTADRTLDYRHTGSHVIVCLQKNRQQNDHQRRHYNPYIWILQSLPIEISQRMKCHTENNAECRTAQRQPDDLQTGHHLKHWHMTNLEHIRIPICVANFDATSEENTHGTNAA